MEVQRGTIEGEDGTRVSYEVEGQGPALVLTNGLTTTSTFWKYLKPHWASRYRVLTWDFPGHGASSPARSPASATIEGQPALLSRVMDAASIDCAVHIGFSVGCQVVFEMYKQRPERCRALVALLGSAGHVLSTTRLPIPSPALQALLRHTPDSVFSPCFRAFARAANSRSGQQLGRRLGLVGPSALDGDLQEVTQHLTTLDPATMRAMACSAEAHSAFDVLPHLRVPLLILAGDKDPFAPAETVGVRMHQKAPRSELVRLPHGTHTALLEDFEEIGREVDRFLARLS